MAFGSIKADNIIYDDGTQEVTASVQSLASAGASITTNATNIATNAADIATNSTDIATNATAIATNATDIATSATNIATNASGISTNATAIATKAPLASPQFTGIPAVRGDGTTDGQIQLNCSVNTHGVKIKSPPHSANASYTLTLPNNTGTIGQFLKTDGSGALSWSSVDLSSKADINSPTFTGTPALTQSPADTTNDQTIADCQFVGARINKLEGTWTAINSATNLVVFTQYLLDSTSGVFTVTLPASPSIGDVITLADQTGQYSTNNVTVARNGNNINGAANDLVLDVDRSVVRLIWSGNATVGWFVK